MNKIKRVAIIGLGLIGASFAMAAKNAGYYCLGFDIQEKINSDALAQNVIDRVWQQSDEVDLYIIALYPSATVNFVKQNVQYFSKGAIVADTSGTKRNICSVLTPVCADAGCFFVGAHPMSGKTENGFFNASSKLFTDACIILCETDLTCVDAVSSLCDFALNIGFSDTTRCSPEHHDEMISYTSALAHILSGAYIQNEKSAKHKGYSAGSFEDLSRVAQLDSAMWSELMLENSDNLSKDILFLIQKLYDYYNALQKEDIGELANLLEVGSNAKIYSRKQK